MKNLFELFVIFIFRFVWRIGAEPFAFIASNLYIKVALDMLADDESIKKNVKYSHLPMEKVLELRDSCLSSNLQQRIQRHYCD